MMSPFFKTILTRSGIVAVNGRVANVFDLRTFALIVN